LNTTLTPVEIRSKVLSSIENYLSLADTEKFNGKFRYSKFVSVIDNSDSSISSNNTKVILRKDFYPLLNITSYYELCFQNSFDVDCEYPSMTSTALRVSEYPNFDVYLEDRNGKIVLYRIASGVNNKVVVNHNVGSIDYHKGEIKLYGLTIIKGSYSDNKIEVRVKPQNNDINASRNVYLDVDIEKSRFATFAE
jgi:hypothetical protein